MQYTGIKGKNLNFSTFHTFHVLNAPLPEPQRILALYQGHHSPVHGLLVRGQPDVQLDQSLAPLLDKELEAVPTAAGDTAAGNVQVLNVPARQPHQGRVRDPLAASNVQETKFVGLFQDALDLAVVHAVEVSALVDPDGELLEIGEAWRGHLLSHWRLIKSQHGVGRAERCELGTTLLKLLDVDENGVARRRRNVGHVEEFQILGVRLKYKQYNKIQG